MFDALARQQGLAFDPALGLGPARPGNVALHPVARRRALADLGADARARLLGEPPPEVPPSRCQAAHPTDAATAIGSFALRLGHFSATAVVDGPDAHGAALAEELRAWAEAGAPSLAQKLAPDDPRIAATRLLLPPAACACALFGNRRDHPALDWLARLARRSAPSAPALAGGPKAGYCRAAVDVGAMALACLTGDPQGFGLGLARYELLFRQMRIDGSWPEAAGYGALALHVHVRHLAAAIALAELGTAQGLDLYGARPGGRDLHRAVDVLLDALETAPAHYPGTGCGGAAPAQMLTFLHPTPDGRHALAWTEPYLARFGATPTGVRLRQALGARLRAARPLRDDLLFGNATALFAAPDDLR